MITKITIEDDYKTITINLKKRDLDIHQMFTELIRPALLAQGYGEKTLNDYFGRIDD